MREKKQWKTERITKMCVRLLEKWQKKLVKIGKIRLRVLCVGRPAPFFNLPANAHSKYIKAKHAEHSYISTEKETLKGA